ncbi:YkgJ family cysteine cluster protein [Desulfamplus magnetovallimortis]|nr:YkgJ family cysteine cluster protein [Desulfamplus magnetovallimortis]
MNFEPHFKKYEELVVTVDAIFDKVKSEYPKEVFCREKCSDCCYAIFDIPIIEAVYLNQKFNEHFSGVEKRELIDIAAKVDRSLFKMKRDAHKEAQDGKDQIQIVAKMSMERVRCPLLGKNDLCLLYKYRPLTCRVYGIPTATAGESHICGRTNFKQGEQYPTLNMDSLYSKLQLISAEMTADLKATNIKVCEMLIPVSMALITDFNEAFFGIE